jgi:two-component sensor histidine kinase
MLEQLIELDLPARLEPRLPAPLTRAATGASLAAIAIALRYGVLWVAPGVAPFALIFPAVLAATMLSGWVAGAITLVFAELADWRLFLADPPGPAILTLGDEIELALFTASAGALIFLTESFVQGARAAARRRELEVRVAHREQERQQLIAQELNHRVKNTLAVVESIARQTFRGDRADAGARDEFSARLQALAAAHDLLLLGQGTAVDLRQMIARVIAPFCPSGDERRIELDGPDLQLAPDGAVAFTLAFHELATNASKYGALSMAAGRVQIRWTRVVRGTEQRVELTWRELHGPPVRAPTRRGFGSRLIEDGLKAELGALVHLDFAPEGLICTITASLHATDQTAIESTGPEAVAAS